MRVGLAISAAVAVAMLTAAGCVGGAAEGNPDEPVFGQVRHDPALTIQRSSNEVTGTLADDGLEIQFSSVAHEDGSIDVRVELNGMSLTARYAADGEALAGVNASDGSPTILTDVDRAAVRRLLAGLEAELFPPVDHATSKEEYAAVRRLTKAEERLYRVVDAQWSQWPSTLPLEHELRGDTPRSFTSYRRFASTNTTVTGCHDCNVCSFAGDCCDAGKKLGESFNGDNYGNCGTSSTGTQFTKDCTNHDQCVRTTRHGGHSFTSLYCDDQFSACVDDEASAPSCTFDWRGTTRKGNCPTSWNGDGSCDCFCQFQDSDC